MTKEDLKQYLEHQKSIDRLSERIQSVKNQLYDYKATIINDMPKGTTANDKTDYLIDLKNTLIEEYRAKQQEYHIEMLRIENAIMQLSDERYKTLLSLRYLDGRTWDYIAENMGFEDNTWVRTELHSRALKAISKK